MNYFVIKIAIICLAFNTLHITGLAQTSLFKDSLEHRLYSNKFILNGKEGTIFLFPSDSNRRHVVVHWTSGYTAFGELLDGIETGNWYIYDGKNRLREFLTFGPIPQCLVYSKTLNRKGHTVSEFKTTTPCF